MAAGVLDFYDLDAISSPGRPDNGPPQLRAWQAEHVAQRRVLIGVRRLARDFETEPVTVKSDPLLEIRHDRAEEVAGADDKALARGRYRWRLRGDDCGAEDKQEKQQSRHGRILKQNSSLNKEFA